MKSSLRFFLFFYILDICFLNADQPIMNEVPRWDGGYGIQVFQEFRWSDELKLGKNKLANPNGLDYKKQMTHIEGVYTWTKWIRATFKIPIVSQERKILDANNQVVEESGTGLGDVKLALSLRKYVNKRKFSGHLGITPQIRLAGEDKHSFQISDGSTDPGISFSGERETAFTKFAFDFTYWFEQEKNIKDEWSIDLTGGWNFHDSGALLLESEWVTHKENRWWGLGPTLFWNFNDTLMSRVEYKFSIQEKRKTTSLLRGDSIRIGLGVVF